MKTIFILGIMGRSGTNYLLDLLGRHPHCGRAESPFWEDWTLHYAWHLREYAMGIQSQHSEPGFPGHEATRDRVLRALGNGLLELIREGHTDDTWVVTKTPSIVGFEYMQALFPEATPVFLIRDGRAVAESYARSFDVSRLEAAEWWSKAALNLAAYRENIGRDVPLVRYENLVTDLTGELRRLFGLVGLDPDQYDYEEAAAMPVRGSSAFGTRNGKVHWDPVTKDSSFDPLNRAAHWSPAECAAFDEVAGEAMAKLGYSGAAEER